MSFGREIAIEAGRSVLRIIVLVALVAFVSGAMIVWIFS